ncbi:MAG TPA: hypothetical protein VF897_11410 [Roseiflexaceae bacterium]
MSAPAAFVVSTASDLPPEDRAALLLALRSQADVQDAQPKSVDWQMVIAVIKQSGEIADALTKLAALATLVYGWAESVRASGHRPRAKLERPGQPPLDLATADEQEILAWLLKNPPAQSGGS